MAIYQISKKKNFSRNNFNSTKLIQKYSDLAREALSTGDKILYESYLQHAEHFIRLSQNLVENTSSSKKFDQNLSEINVNKIGEEDKLNNKDDLKSAEN